MPNLSPRAEHLFFVCMKFPNKSCRPKRFILETSYIYISSMLLTIDLIRSFIKYQYSIKIKPLAASIFLLKCQPHNVQNSQYSCVHSKTRYKNIKLNHVCTNYFKSSFYKRYTGIHYYIKLQTIFINNCNKIKLNEFPLCNIPKSTILF